MSRNEHGSSADDANNGGREDIAHKYEQTCGSGNQIGEKKEPEGHWPTRVQHRAEQGGEHPHRFGESPPTLELGSLPRLVEITADHARNERFQRHLNLGEGATGFDGTYSLRLLSGDTLWLVSDAFVGAVRPDGTRPFPARMIDNAFLLEARDGKLKTVHAGTAERPEALVAGEDPSSWYWMGHGIVNHGGLDVMCYRLEGDRSSMWDWGWSRNVIARFSGDQLKLQDLVPAPSSAGIKWGSWLLQEGGYTYIYGTEDRQLEKYAHVARVAGDDLTGPWEFSAGEDWSPNEHDSARALRGVATQYSVTRLGDLHVLVTHEAPIHFSNEIHAWFSASPAGPFVGKSLIYRTPEDGPQGAYGNPDVYSYDALEHPHLRRRPDELVISYNVNSKDYDEAVRERRMPAVFQDASIYRPRFVHARFTYDNG